MSLTATLHFAFRIDGRSHRCALPILLALVLCWGSTGAGWAQHPSPDSSRTALDTRFCRQPPSDRALDAKGLALVYCTEPTGLAWGLRAAHATARPVFYGAVPATWAGTAILRDDPAFGDAYRLTLTTALTYGLVAGLKRIVGRPRPYVTQPLTSREEHDLDEEEAANRAFPSGHAALSAALVTSWSLSHPRWYVIAPGVLWAAGVAASRPYLGVHFPSDVLAGVLLGAGVALLVHQLRSALTPPALEGAQEPGGHLVMPVGVRISL